LLEKVAAASRDEAAGAGINAYDGDKLAARLTGHCAMGAPMPPASLTTAELAAVKQVRVRNIERFYARIGRLLAEAAAAAGERVALNQQVYRYRAVLNLELDLDRDAALEVLLGRRDSGPQQTGAAVPDYDFTLAALSGKQGNRDADALRYWFLATLVDLHETVCSLHTSSPDYLYGFDMLAGLPSDEIRTAAVGEADRMLSSLKQQADGVLQILLADADRLGPNVNLLVRFNLKPRIETMAQRGRGR